MMLTIQRIYQSPVVPGTYRILVDRIWPRGISKVKAQLDLWAKEIAPTTELRKWFNHDPEKFPEFQQRYRAELDANPDFPVFLAQVKAQLTQGDVVLLYGAKDQKDNQAQVLLAYLQTKLTTN
uniref:DUF488 domain-containing protein n=1 Tax=Lapidilactobacillus luobeiensis TaxID=2950371 RepID=UPI0021C277DB|nr:DUF488 family protein [Lapidilactobacillus luobeiensis]